MWVRFQCVCMCTHACTHGHVYMCLREICILQRPGKVVAEIDTWTLTLPLHICWGYGLILLFREKLWISNKHQRIRWSIIESSLHIIVWVKYQNTGIWMIWWQCWFPLLSKEGDVFVFLWIWVFVLNWDLTYFWDLTENHNQPESNLVIP